MFNQISQFVAAIAPFAITGVVTSGIVQYAKNIFDKTTHKVLLLVGTSVAVGGVAYFTGYIPENFLTAIVGVLASANTVYVLIVRWFEPAPVQAPVPPVA